MTKPNKRNRGGRGRRSGSAMVELALSGTLLFTCLFGTLEFGLAFYDYNLVQSAVRNAARYGSLSAYDLPGGTAWKQQVTNMAVYGDPDGATDRPPLLSGLTTNMIQVSTQTVNGLPERVTVAVQGFQVQLMGNKLSIDKPVVTFPFVGRVVVP